MRLGTDIGGTFTDFVLVDEAGRVRLHKRLTTPDDPARSVLEGVAELGLPATPADEVVHGSTIATNALLERRGARTALITTQGFADVLEIGRQNRPDLYALVPTRPAPLVPRAWRFELPERVSAQGEVLRALDPADIDALLPRLREAGIEAVAVCFLFSFLHPQHERMVKERLEIRDWRFNLQSLISNLYISLSSDILPEYREYERTAATVINAYVTPLMDRYLGRLEAALAPRPLRIMQSNGGCLTATTARRQAARTALSGPAGGVVGAFSVGVASLGTSPSLITFDMGGTSTDVCLCPGAIPFTAEGELATLGLPLRLPLIDIHTVGAGGGSLARVDLGGALVVGPESAGADPGPVCYGRAGPEALPTVTDANLILGRLDPAHFLGGRMTLDTAAAEAALARLAQGLLEVAGGRQTTDDPAGRRGAGGRRTFESRQSVEGSRQETQTVRDRVPPSVAAAWGVLQVANAAMERAIRKVSVERGYDPADFTLVAFGGAGPLHACELAERLSIPRVMAPRAPGVLSALGMLVADLVKDYATTVMQPLAGLDIAALAALFAPWEARAQAEMGVELGAVAAPVRLERSADLRYAGQSFEINVPAEALTPEALAAEFHARHARRYGHAHPEEPLEVVTLRVRAVGVMPQPAFETLPRGGPDPGAAQVGVQPVWFETDAGLAALPTRLYDRERLLAGQRVAGPAVLFQLDATTVLPPGWVGEVDEVGHLLIEKN